MGRKSKTDRPVEWKVYVPTSIAAPFALLTTEPTTGRQMHGARSEIVSALVEALINTYAGHDPAEQMKRALATAEKFFSSTY